MKVSIILPTKNNKKTIKKCLESICKQTYKNIEVIFVDNFSDDDTYEIAESFKNKIDIKLFKKWPERNLQRPFWASKASWEIYYFIDSDMYLEEKLIWEAVKLIEKNKEIWAIIVPEENIIYNSFWSKVKAFERSLYNWDDKVEAARIFKKEVYNEIWWYNIELISWEDWDLSDRVREKNKTDRIKSKVKHDEWEVKIIELLKKKFYYWEKFTIYSKNNWIKQAWSKIFYLRKSFYTNYKKYLKNPILFIWMFIMLNLTILFFWVWYIKWKLKK